MPVRSNVGEVAKRSNAADCKSVALAASKVRILPSPPVDLPQRGSLVAGRVSDASNALSERSESKGGSNSVVESQPSKLLVAGSIPVSRSRLRLAEASAATRLRLGRLDAHKADVAQLAERVLGKDEVTSSILVIGSRLRLAEASAAARLRPGRRAVRLRRRASSGQASE